MYAGLGSFSSVLRDNKPQQGKHSAHRRPGGDGFLQQQHRGGDRHNRVKVDVVAGAGSANIPLGGIPGNIAQGRG